MVITYKNIPIDHRDEKEKIAEAIDLMLASDWEPRHAIQVRRLALAIFDGLRGLHAMSARDRLILEAAALVHDVGLAVSQKGHHKLSFGIIREKLKERWSRREALLVALVARYHRKAVPRPEHPAYGDLSAADRAKVSRLAAILRIADGLDRTHTGAVKGINADFDERRALFTLVGSPSPTDEWGAKRKSNLFGDAFHLSVEFAWSGGEGI